MSRRGGSHKTHGRDSAEPTPAGSSPAPAIMHGALGSTPDKLIDPRLLPASGQHTDHNDGMDIDMTAEQRTFLAEIEDPAIRAAAKEQMLMTRFDPIDLEDEEMAEGSDEEYEEGIDEGFDEGIDEGLDDESYDGSDDEYHDVEMGDEIDEDSDEEMMDAYEPAAPAKKPTKKTAEKSAKKPAKVSAKEPVKKTAKKVAKESSKKSAKKAAKEPAKKPAKKTKKKSTKKPTAESSDESSDESAKNPAKKNVKKEVKTENAPKRKGRVFVPPTPIDPSIDTRGWTGEQTTIALYPNHTVTLFTDKGRRARPPQDLVTGMKFGCGQCNWWKRDCDLDQPCQQCINAGTVETIGCSYTYKGPKKPREPKGEGEGEDIKKGTKSAKSAPKSKPAAKSKAPSKTKPKPKQNADTRHYLSINPELDINDYDYQFDDDDHFGIPRSKPALKTTKGAKKNVGVKFASQADIWEFDPAEYDPEEELDDIDQERLAELGLLRGRRRKPQPPSGVSNMKAQFEESLMELSDVDSSTNGEEDDDVEDDADAAAEPIPKSRRPTAKKTSVNMTKPKASTSKAPAKTTRTTKAASASKAKADPKSKSKAKPKAAPKKRQRRSTSSSAFSMPRPFKLPRSYNPWKREPYPLLPIQTEQSVFSHSSLAALGINLPHYTLPSGDGDTDMLDAAEEDIVLTEEEKCKKALAAPWRPYVPPAPVYDFDRTFPWMKDSYKERHAVKKPVPSASAPQYNILVQPGQPMPTLPNGHPRNIKKRRRHEILHLFGPVTLSEMPGTRDQDLTVKHDTIGLTGLEVAKRVFKQDLVTHVTLFGQTGPIPSPFLNSERMQVGCRECRLHQFHCNLGNPCSECERRGKACYWTWRPPFLKEKGGPDFDMREVQLAMDDLKKEHKRKGKGREE